MREAGRERSSVTAGVREIWFVPAIYDAILMHPLPHSRVRGP